MSSAAGSSSTAEGRAEPLPTEAEQLFQKAVLAVSVGPEGQKPQLFNDIINGSNEVTKTFCCEVVDAIATDISKVSAYSRQCAREKALRRFHQLRIGKLPDIWRRTEQTLGLPPTKAVILQSINRFIFNELLLKHFAVACPSDHNSSTKDWGAMSADEEASVRYAGGYVAMKLKKQFIKKNCAKAGQFVECLSHMAVEGNESSFLEYTKMWTSLVNRGGLFELNDTTYLLFKSIELKTQDILPHHLKKLDTTATKEDIIQAIKTDENVQIIWNLLSIDISDDDDAQELLQRIVEMWVTVRGFSMTSFWIEQYKQANHVALKAKKALRKTLKKKD